MITWKKVKANFCPYLDCAELSKNIKLHGQGGQKRFIIEGVCLLEVLELINLKPSILIYVKRLSGDRFWDDEYICSPKLSLDEAYKFIEKFEHKQGMGSFDREIAEYHRCFKPIERTDYIFIRKEKMYYDE